MLQVLLILIALFLFIAFIWGVKSVVTAIVSVVRGNDTPAAQARIPLQTNAHHSEMREALDALKEAHALYVSGVLTQEELDQLKREILH